jgi:hypothetical protein
MQLLWWWLSRRQMQRKQSRNAKTSQVDQSDIAIRRPRQLLRGRGGCEWTGFFSSPPASVWGGPKFFPRSYVGEPISMHKKKREMQVVRQSPYLAQMHHLPHRVEACGRVNSDNTGELSPVAGEISWSCRGGGQLSPLRFSSPNDQSD